MRTQPAHIEPGCPYCNHDHNPDIECQFKPESIRFQLQDQPAPARREVRTIRDRTGKIIAVKHV